MPVEFNDTIDEPLVYDRQNAFLRQRSFGRANLLTEQEASELKNVQPDTSGVTRNRRGFRHIVDVGGSGTVQAGGFFDGSSDYNFVVRNGVAYFYNSVNSETSVTLTTNASTTNQAYWCQVADNLYVSTGNASEPLHQISAGLTEYEDTSGNHGLKYLTSQGYRVFAVEDPDRLYATDILPASGAANYFTNSTTNTFIRIGQDYRPITGLFAWQDNNLLVFKDESMFMVNVNPVVVTNTASGNDLANAAVRKISDRIGTVSHKSVAQVGNDALFLARDGVRSVARVIHDGMASTTEPLSLPIQDLIDRINWQYADTSVACYRERKYLLAVPLDSATTPNTILCFDNSTGGWFYWTGVNVSDFIYTNFTEPVLSAAATAGYIAEFRDYTDLDNVTRGDYIDFLDDSGTSTGNWSDNGGYVSFTFSTPSLSVGDMVYIEAFSGAYNVIDVTGSVATINYATSGAGAPASVSFIKGAKPDWAITSRSFVFGEGMNPKCLDWVECEFARDSDAYCDLSILLDDSDATEVESNFASGGGNSITLPVTLPFTIPRGKFTRKRFGLYGEQDLAREIQFKITESDTASAGELVSSRVVALRSVTAAGFVEEFEELT